METSLKPSFLENVAVAYVILGMRFGGGERLVHDLSIAMQKENAKCHVICLDLISGNTEPLFENGVSLELIQRKQTIFDISACRRLIRRLRDLRIRLIHAHDLSSLAYAVAAGLILGIPVVMTEHSRHYIDARGLRRLEKRLLCLGVRQLVEVSPELAQASIRRDGIRPDKVRVIENGVDTLSFSRAAGRTLRTELDLADETLLCGMVGRLETIKGPDVLLEAFAGLAGRMPGVHLAYAGEGGLLEGLRARAEALGLADRVHFLGPRSDVADIMAGLDVLVLPSRSEGLPFALLEGMAAGRAVVATHVGRVPELVEPAKGSPSGLLVPPDDVPALAGALADLLSDKALRQRLGRAGHDFVAQRYDHRTMIADYQAVYRRVLTERPCS